MQKVTAIVSKETNRISLVQGHDYDVIGIDDTSFYIVDESCEPAMYPKSYFLDSEIEPPKDWHYQDFGDGEYAYFPTALASKGFFEGYADGLNTSVQGFREFLMNNNLLKQ